MVERKVRWLGDATVQMLLWKLSFYDIMRLKKTDRQELLELAHERRDQLRIFVYASSLSDCSRADLIGCMIRATPAATITLVIILFWIRVLTDSCVKVHHRIYPYCPYNQHNQWTTSNEEGVYICAMHERLLAHVWPSDLKDTRISICLTLTNTSQSNLSRVILSLIMYENQTPKTTATPTTRLISQV